MEEPNRFRTAASLARISHLLGSPAFDEYVEESHSGNLGMDMDAEVQQQFVPIPLVPVQHQVVQEIMPVGQAAAAAAAMEDEGAIRTWAVPGVDFEGFADRRLSDPIKNRHRRERTTVKLGQKFRYGSGSTKQITNRYLKARNKMYGDQSHNVEAIMATQLQNRMNDGFTGRGMYTTGRGRYKRRARGRGMYTAGQIPHYGGSGSYWNTMQSARRSIASGARFVNRNYSRAATIGAGGATLLGRPDIAAGLMGSTGAVNRVSGFIGGRGAYNTLFPELGPVPVEFDSATSEHGNLIVSGSEKVMDVFGNSAGVNFSTVAIPLFPGNFEHFPKLAQHAADFKEYEYVQMIFTYKTNIASNWSTDSVTTGKVIMATQMDVSRDPWSTYDELASVENKTEGLVTGLNEEDRMHTHGVECEPSKLTSKGLKFVRTKGLTGKQDLVDYDLGRFQFGLFGTGVNLEDKMIGELWVQYKVVFKNHRMYSMLGLNIPQSLWRTQNYSRALGSTDDNVETLMKLATTELFSPDELQACDYNNITPLITSEYKEAAIPSQNVWWGALGATVKLVFSSNLRGDYEIEMALQGTNLIPSDNATGVDDAYLRWYTDPKLPDVTGVVQLNSDIGMTADGTAQQPIQYCFSPELCTIKVHVHLGQATSTEDNSVEIFFPLYLADAANNVAQAQALAESQYTAETSTFTIKDRSLSIRQYNAYTLFGAKGFPYT